MIDRPHAPPSALGRVLVLGATGMLGHAAMAVLSEEADVVGSVRDVEAARALGVSGGALVPFVVDRDEVGALLDRVTPGAVLNAIGAIKQREEGRLATSAIRLNGLFPHEVHEACAARGIRFVHVSTDCVFSGAKPISERYRESDTPDAQDVYGRSKLLGELFEGPGITLRTSIIGPVLQGEAGLLAWFAGCGGREVPGFTRAIFSGLTTRELARVVADVLVRRPELSGLWHVAAEPIDKYALLLKLRAVLGVACEVHPIAEPVLNRALDASRFTAATGYTAPAWDDMLAADLEAPRG